MKIQAKYFCCSGTNGIGILNTGVAGFEITGIMQSEIH